MRRTDPNAFVLQDTPALGYPAEQIVAALAPVVTEARLSRIRHVVAQRTRRVVPVLDRLADPHNVAAVLRSADAFGVQDVHLVETQLPFAASHRVTRGTERWLTLHRHRSVAACADALRAEGYLIAVASMEGRLLPADLRSLPKVAVVLGNEHAGPSPEMVAVADATYRIPMRGFVESLNVSVAAAITLHAATDGIAGDLDDAERTELEARLLLATVRDADRIVAEHAKARA